MWLWGGGGDVVCRRCWGRGYDLFPFPPTYPILPCFPSSILPHRDDALTFAEISPHPPPDYIALSSPPPSLSSAPE